MNVTVRLFFTALLAAAITLTCQDRSAAVDVYLSLSSHGQRMELGVAGFLPMTPTIDESKLSRQVQEVLLDDLLFSRYFNIIENGPFYTGKKEELEDWESRGANVLAVGKIKVQGDRMSLTGQLYDVYSKQVIWEKTYTDSASAFRRLAHELNDDIIQRFVGERGIAHTRIVFSNNQSRRKELYVVDYDGHNLRRITSDNSINILPRWAPDGKEIIYTTYAYGNPDLYAVAPAGEHRRAVSCRQGLNTAGSFSPDGTKIALTISQGGSPNLCLISREGTLLKKISSGKAIDTSPAFAPNGREIVFVSDRPGYPQLYIMSLEGGNIRRLFTNGYCDSPAWSPRGDKIVFTMRQGRDNYDLYLYDLASAQVSRLTQNERNNENPSWSPDGRFVVFSSNRIGKSKLYVIAIDGSGLRELGDIPGSSYTPSWSQ
jgi:TolB protein